MADATAVREVLTHPLARVRPPDAAVPPGLVGTIAGDVFARLARTTDGADHRSSRDRLARHLDALDAATVDEAGDAIAASLHRDSDPATIVAWWSRRFPLGVVARLCGMDHARLDELAADVSVIAAAFGPASIGVEPTRLDAAVERVLARAGGTALEPTDALGLLIQTLDATAALVTAGIVRATSTCMLLDGRQAVADVMATEPPVRNTRRWFHADATVSGHRFHGGDGVLLVLVDDPALAFGDGHHRCPASGWAPVIAARAVDRALAELAALTGSTCVPPIRVTGWLPSPNTRCPVLGHEQH